MGAVRSAAGRSLGERPLKSAGDRVLPLDRANDRIPEPKEMLTLLRAQRDELPRPEGDLRRRPGRGREAGDCGCGCRVSSTRCRRRRPDRRLGDHPSRHRHRPDRLPGARHGRQVWLCWRLGEGPRSSGGTSSSTASRAGVRWSSCMTGQPRRRGRPAEGLPAAVRGRPPDGLRRRARRLRPGRLVPGPRAPRAGLDGLCGPGRARAQPAG